MIVCSFLTNKGQRLGSVVTTFFQFEVRIFEVSLYTCKVNNGNFDPLLTTFITLKFEVRDFSTIHKKNIIGYFDENEVYITKKVVVTMCVLCHNGLGQGTTASNAPIVSLMILLLRDSGVGGTTTIFPSTSTTLTSLSQSSQSSTSSTTRRRQTKDMAEPRDNNFDHKGRIVKNFQGQIDSLTFRSHPLPMI